jgi:hypothetical protein
MIIEFRTLTVQLRSQNKVLERIGQALPARAALSPLGGCWYSDVGVLNQIYQVWPYESLAHLEQVQAEAKRLEGWPADIAEFVVEEETKILEPAPFSPPLTPRRYGEIYEIRTYTYPPNCIDQVIDSWKEVIDERIKFSPLAGAWYSTMGPLNQWIHVWPFKDSAERERIRVESVKAGIWPPRRNPLTLRMHNVLAVPAAFSPLR